MRYKLPVDYERIKKARLDDCLNVTQVADAINVANSTIYMAENGYLTPRVFFMLCDLYNLNPVELISENAKARIRPIKRPWF